MLFYRGSDIKINCKAGVAVSINNVKGPINSNIKYRNDADCKLNAIKQRQAAAQTYDIKSCFIK